MPAMCSIDGELTTDAAATVAMLDRGFLTGSWDAEYLRTEAGLLLAWPEHVTRLRARAEQRGTPLAVGDAELMRCVVATMRATGFAECLVQLYVLAGEARQTWAVQVRELDVPRAPIRLGLVRLEDPGGMERLQAWLRAGLGRRNVLAAFDDGGNVAAAPDGGALFVWVGDRLCTPPVPAAPIGASAVERELLVAFCREQGVAVDDRLLPPDLVRAADDAFVTSTQRGVEPVSHVDDRALHDGHAGKRATDLAAAFEDHCARLCREHYEPRLAALLGG